MSLQETVERIAASGLPLQGKLDAFKVEFETNFAPPPLLAIMHKATKDLIASGQAGRALKAGDRAPEFTLLDSDGKSVSSAELLSRSPLVVSFYRGTWCPYCNFDLAALEEARAQIEQRGGTLVAISQQTAANNRKAKLANKLGFPILGDNGGVLAAEFGVRWNVPDDLKEVHKMVGADLETFNGETSWTLPMPARYVIGQDGVIAYSEVNPDYTRRPDPTDLYPVLDALRTAQPA